MENSLWGVHSEEEASQHFNDWEFPTVALLNVEVELFFSLKAARLEELIKKKLG